MKYTELLCCVLGCIDVALLCIPVSVFFLTCGAKPTWRQPDRNTGSFRKKNMLTEAYHVHSDGALCFYISLQPLQTSQLLTATTTTASIMRHHTLLHLLVSAAVLF